MKTAILLFGGFWLDVLAYAIGLFFLVVPVVGPVTFGQAVLLGLLVKAVTIGWIFGIFGIFGIFRIGWDWLKTTIRRRHWRRNGDPVVLNWSDDDDELELEG